MTLRHLLAEGVELRLQVRVLVLVLDRLAGSLVAAAAATLRGPPSLPALLAIQLLEPGAGVVRGGRRVPRPRPFGGLSRAFPSRRERRGAPPLRRGVERLPAAGVLETQLVGEVPNRLGVVRLPRGASCAVVDAAGRVMEVAGQLLRRVRGEFPMVAQPVFKEDRTAHAGPVRRGEPGVLRQVAGVPGGSGAQRAGPVAGVEASVASVEVIVRRQGLGTMVGGEGQSGGGAGPGVLHQPEAELESQELGPEAGVLLQQSQDAALQHHVVDAPLLPRALGRLVVLPPLVPVAFVLFVHGDELALASHAAGRGGALLALDGRAASQQGACQQAAGGQDGHGFICGGQRPSSSSSSSSCTGIPGRL
ncbi:hypothetical protein EYF80_048512 [Liparis tanakae]|uniref:Uncharacterized protein n=1 Tax=Liparis tanakae TaxID=230148 RepID=A0A4Z2FJJ1_9TELE|nr:hypothetical protein EYF80_048512 [Liparis tanakae]